MALQADKVAGWLGRQRRGYWVAGQEELKCGGTGRVTGWREKQEIGGTG